MALRAFSLRLILHERKQIGLHRGFVRVSPKSSPGEADDSGGVSVGGLLIGPYRLGGHGRSLVIKALFSRDIWPRLTVMAQSRRGLVAVPYFGNKGAKDLPLRPGSTLVVNCQKACVLAGQVKPSELLALLRNGVEIHSCHNLHAKVFVFGRTAIVGSTNVSTLSNRHLLEAAIETTDREVVAACRAFVGSLRGDVVTEKYLIELDKLYEAPKLQRAFGSPRSGSTPEHSPVWGVPIGDIELDDVDEANLAAAHEIGDRLADRHLESVDDFVWYGKSFASRLESGHRIVLCSRHGRKPTTISPLGRVLSVQRYAGARGLRAAVIVAFPKGKRQRQASAVVQRLGPAAKALAALKGPRLLRDKSFVVSLGQLWATKKK